MNILDKAIAGKELDEQSWKEIVYGVDEEGNDSAIDFKYITCQIMAEYDDYCKVLTVIEYKGKYYGVTWEEGTIDYEEDDFSNCKLFEVEKVPVTTYEWRIKG